MAKKSEPAKCYKCGKLIEFKEYTKSDGSKGFFPVDPGKDSHECGGKKEEPAKVEIAAEIKNEPVYGKPLNRGEETADYEDLIAELKDHALVFLSFTNILEAAEKGEDYTLTVIEVKCLSKYIETRYREIKNG